LTPQLTSDAHARFPAFAAVDDRVNLPIAVAASANLAAQQKNVARR